MARTLQTSVLTAFNKAVDDNSHVTDVDLAAVEAGRSIAAAIDDIMADPKATPTEKTKALYLTPHLISILKELLATPLARKQVGLAANEGKSASRLKLIQGQATASATAGGAAIEGGI